MSARVVLSTRNAHKVGEVRAILAEALPGVSEQQLRQRLVGVEGLEVADVVESGVTFEENALLKARAACAATDLPALADDSGLCVDVLGGAPGIFSARWAGRHGDDAANLRLLLDQLADVPDGHRRAGFTACVALVLPDGRELTRTGELVGTLTREPCGTGGFGYDPIVWLDEEGSTVAELSAERKNGLSHRSQAVRALADELAPLLAD